MKVDCWLVQIEWRHLDCLVLPSTIKSRRSFLLASAHPGGPGKRALKRLAGDGGGSMGLVSHLCTHKNVLTWAVVFVNNGRWTSSLSNVIDARPCLYRQLRIMMKDNIFILQWPSLTNRLHPCLGQMRQINKVLLLDEEAVASSSVGNTLWCVSTIFMRPAITPPEVNRFGWNLGHSEYIVWSWPWQIFGVIFAEARAGERAKFFFLR